MTQVLGMAVLLVMTYLAFIMLMLYTIPLIIFPFLLGSWGVRAKIVTDF